MAALAALSSCARDTTASPPSSATASAPVEPVVPEGFARTNAVLAPAGRRGEGVELDVWYAATPTQWHLGLTAVTDLAGADGMLFVFDGEAERRFYMWRTPMPLDIHFFDTLGRLVGSERMTPCLDDTAANCARYSPGVAFLTALEVPAGALDAQRLDASWTIRFDRPPAPDG